jgi:hypothetical protein
LGWLFCLRLLNTYSAFVLFFETQFEVKQNECEHKHHRIGGDNGAAIDCKGVHEPYNGAGKNNEDHPDAEVTNAF